MTTDSASSAPVLVAIDEGVATVTLNRPERLNAMNHELVMAAGDAFAAVNADPSVRAVVFRGAGRAFCAGDDRKDHRHPADAAAARVVAEAIQRVTREIVLGPKLVVGAIRGWAVGGGFEWAINCDFPIWGRGARAFFPEVSLGLFVTGAVTTLLPDLVGLQKAKELMLFGEQLDAAEALELGIAWRVVEDGALDAEAALVARRLAELPAHSAADTKRALNRAAFADVERAMEVETEALTRLMLDPAATERVSSFGAGSA